MKTNKMLKAHRNMGYDNAEIIEMLKIRFEDTYKEVRQRLIDECQDIIDIAEILEEEGDIDNSYLASEIANDMDRCETSDIGRDILRKKGYNV